MTILKGKSIIITGGSSGIGAATAMRAAKAGALVTIADINDTAGQSVLAEIEKEGGQAQFVCTDILNEDQVRTMVDAAISRFGGLHGAFNNAGVPGYSHRPGNPVTRFADFTLEAFHSGFDANVVGTFLCMKHEIQAMLQAGCGAIVNTASTVGILAIHGAPDYVSAKHAVIGLTKSAALDYATDNIRVNAVLPGIIRTPMLERSIAANPDIRAWAEGMHPVKRLGKPLEIGEAAMWLLSDAASFVTGISMPVDGGLSMV